MKSARFKRTKSVMASGAIALVIAALAFGVSSSVLGTRSAIAQHLGFDLTSGASSFTITSTTYTTPSGAYPAASCSGTPALLTPAVTRCMVFSVHNSLSVPITVQSITTTLDTTNFPAPPADCKGTNLELPTFSGSLSVPGHGDASSSGVPIELKDNGEPQNDCENSTYHFVYSGTANYTEVYGTSTGVVTSQNPSTVGQSVTYTATVTASATGSQDPVPSSPTGTVTFKDNGTTICTAPVAVASTGTATSTAQCTVNYATTTGSPHPITASYTNTDGNFTNSNGSLSQVVNSGTTHGSTSSLTSSVNPSNFGQSVTFTDTVSGSSGTPTGAVTFYNCGSSSNCSSKSAFGQAVNLTSGKATFAASTLPAGTTYIEAIYVGSGTYSGSTSNVVAQVVKAISTSTSLNSSLNPSNFGQPVIFTATVSSGSGTPGGTVTFYSCTNSGCGTKTAIGSGTLNSSDKASTSASTLPVGTTYVEAVYGASGNFLGSTSTPLGQVVKPVSISTSTSLSSSLNPSNFGQSVNFTATVTSGSGTPSGSVTFYSCTNSTCGAKSPLASPVNLSSSKATLTTSTLPVGTTYVEAVYGASGNFLGSTSNALAQVVKVSVPSVCATSGYGNYILGSPSSPFVNGTNGNDFIYAFGASFWFNGFGGNDCIDAGDGNNVVTGGDGNDGVSAGNGSNAVILGNGNDKVSLGSGSDGVWAGNGTNAISTGNGSNNTVILGNGSDTVTVGNGSGGRVRVGNGNDAVTVGTGSDNQVQLGSGSDTVTIKGSHDEIDGGNGSETVILGSGTFNTYSGQAHHTNICHLPKPPSSWHGTVAAYYHDTITNCTVVTS
jgi:hypothetical protein